MKLNDGTVIPSFLGAARRGGNHTSNPTLNDQSLRMGEIKKIVFPEDPTSYSGKFIEYEIDIVYRDGESGSATSRYRGVSCNNIFGGLADKFTATYRANPNPANYSQEGLGVGSKVLIMCVSGNQQQAIILGGLRDPNDTKDSRDDGHNLFFEFNGIQAAINDDGEFSLTFKGKTKVDGELADSAIADAEGSQFAINKQGNLLLATPEQNQYVNIDHENRKIDILADSEWNVTINGTTLIHGTDTLEVKTDDEMTLRAGAKIIMKSTGVKVGQADEAWVLGTTYRQNESQMFQQCKSYLQVASGLLSTAATLNSTPTIGGALAATAFSAVSQMLQQVSTAMGTFEGSAENYLSKRNFGDK
jgi:hypothetical protein